MKRQIKSSYRASNVLYPDCLEEVVSQAIDGIESGEFFSYDDVVSEVYAEIQSYFEAMGEPLSDQDEDMLYEDAMGILDDEGYIDHRRGILLV